MVAPADGTTLPDAGSKLRMVLDYVPCEACLAHPVDDQELLCSLCARLDRQVAVRVSTRTTVLLERPSPPPAVVVIAPASEPAPAEAAPAPEPEPPAPKPIVVRFVDDTLAPPGSIDVVVEPFAPPALPALALAPAPVVAALGPEPAPAMEAEPEPIPDEEPEFDDIVSFTPAREEFFDFKKAPAAAAPPPPPPVVEERAPEPEPQPEPADDFVFRPPDHEAPPPAREPEPQPVEEIVPQEEVPVESAEVQEQWAPPPDFLADEEPEPPIEERPVDTAVVQDAVMEAEEEVLELEQVEDEEEILEMEEVVEMEVVEDDEPAAPVAPVPPAAPAPPAPVMGGDLPRLRGMEPTQQRALHAIGITEVAQLAGQDPASLAERAGIPPARAQAWVHVADLVAEVGVPLDAANALVAAGIAGPKGLSEADADEVADRVAAFGGASIAAKDIKRWKRRA